MEEVRPCQEMRRSGGQEPDTKAQACPVEDSGCYLVSDGKPNTDFQEHGGVLSL